MLMSSQIIKKCYSKDGIGLMHNLLLPFTLRRHPDDFTEIVSDQVVRRYRSVGVSVKFWTYYISTF